MRPSLLAFTCSVLVVGCGKQVDKDKLESTIKAGLAAKGITVPIECPANQKFKKGAKFACTGTADGKPFKVDVTLTDDDGAAEWKLVGAVFDTKVLAELTAPKITEKVGSPATVTCPPKVMILAEGDTLVCDATVGVKTGHVKWAYDPAIDDVNWELQP